MTDRVLEWEGCLNARDLGGYPTVHGGETRWGRVFRSDTPSTLTERGRQALVDSGVRTIVDLRLPSELADHPNPFAQPGEHGITYHHRSFIDPGMLPSDSFTTLANDYISMLDRFQPQVASIMRAIAEAPPEPVLIHCMGGKDRTGIISALLLDLAGVPRTTIGADYALTTERLRPSDEAWLENGPGDRATREFEYDRRKARAEVMLDVLAHLDARYGGVENYLLQGGVTPEEIGRLRDRLTV